MRLAQASFGVGVLMGPSWWAKHHQNKAAEAVPAHLKVTPFFAVSQIKAPFQTAALPSVEAMKKHDVHEMLTIEGLDPTEFKSMHFNVRVWVSTDPYEMSVGHTSIELAAKNKEGKDVSLGYLSLWPEEGIPTVGPTKFLPLPGTLQTLAEDMAEEKKEPHVVAIPLDSQEKVTHAISLMSQYMYAIEDKTLSYQLVYQGLAEACKKQFGHLPEEESHIGENPFFGGMTSGANFLERVAGSSAAGVSTLRATTHHCTTVVEELLSHFGVTRTLSPLEILIGTSKPANFLGDLEKQGFEVRKPENTADLSEANKKEFDDLMRSGVDL